MTSRRGWRAAVVLVATIAFVVSCGKPSGPSVSHSMTTPTSPTPSPSRLSVSTRCAGPFHPGQYVPLACFVFVEDVTHPTSDSFSVRADLRIFGGPAEVIFPRCPACGGPPWTFDLDLNIRPDATPGVKTFPVWATDADGRRADTTAAIEIVVR